MKPIYLLLSISLILSACASPVENASQGIKPTATATIPPSPTATIVPSPTPSPTPEYISMDQIVLMTDPEKIAQVPDAYNSYNKTVSTISPEIVILDDGTSYLAYDIQTGEVSSLAEVDLELIPLNDGTFKEARSFERGEEDNGVRIITADVGNAPYGASKMENHQDVNKHLRLEKSFSNPQTYLGAFAINGEKFGGSGSYWVGYRGYMDDRTLILYLDEEGNFRYALFDISPGEFYSKYYNL
jgi:hypothetical protein